MFTLGIGNDLGISYKYGLSSMVFGLKGQRYKGKGSGTATAWVLTLLRAF